MTQKKEISLEKSEIFPFKEKGEFKEPKGGGEGTPRSRVPSRHKFQI